MRTGGRPATEYWIDVISAIKNNHADFLVIAEAYWDSEWKLQQQGFTSATTRSFTTGWSTAMPRASVFTSVQILPYQGKLLRFIENHDEPRAATTFSHAKERATALTIATLPGIKLFHEGQLEGRRVRLPVFLGRRPYEPEN